MIRYDMTNLRGADIYNLIKFILEINGLLSCFYPFISCLVRHDDTVYNIIKLTTFWKIGGKGETEVKIANLISTFSSTRVLIQHFLVKVLGQL